MIVHFGGFILDMVGGWLLLFPKTRFVAIVFLSKFHIMNATMFEIGMLIFAFVLLTLSLFFCCPFVDLLFLFVVVLPFCSCCSCFSCFVFAVLLLLLFMLLFFCCWVFFGPFSLV